MRNSTTAVLIATHIALIWALAHPAFSAEPVYKCVKNGKTVYTADPRPANGDCQQTEIRNDGPTPEELARLLEEKKLRQAQDEKAREAALKEREVEAKEREAAAATRRARAVELILLQGRQSQPAYQPTYVYPYPYWGGGIRPIQPPPPRHDTADHPAPHYRSFSLPPSQSAPLSRPSGNR